LFHPSIPKIFTAHGLENGKKILRDSAYTYSWKAILKDQESYYTRFLATSPHEFGVASADRYGRAFKNKITVTSQALALRLLDENRYRERLRADLGLKLDNPKAILIMSTWGPNSLLRTVGPAITDETLRLNTKYRFFFFAHAHNFQHKKALQVLNAIKAKGIEVIDPGPLSWIPYAVAADLAISDKTSLSMYFSLLHKPIIFTPIEEGEFVEGSPFLRLYDVSPKFVDPEDLENQIETCLGPEYAARVRAYAEETFPKISQKDHLKSVIYECIRRP
jgi:CDP-glycerol glycerophosphotransferase (TagB/SpsB family)